MPNYYASAKAQVINLLTSAYNWSNEVSKYQFSAS